MVFSSPLFLFVYLPLVLIFYFIAPGTRSKNFVLLFFSFVFYILGEGHYVGVMLLSITLAWISGLWVAHARGESARKFWVGVAVVTNLALLFYYKYAGFFEANVGPWFSRWHIPLHFRKDIHLPVGISFFTFQAMSYVIDLYRQKIPVQRSFFKLAVYKSFFPQLIAGPIVRYGEIGAELERRRFALETFAYGLQRLILGLAKKVLLANTMGSVADKVFQVAPADLSTAQAWVGALAYFFQIYFDFSGYSDMAIGMARMFGFHFNENFQYPYSSRSITEFWRRWHISLSSWFRDYVYIPLGGNRVSPARTYFNLMLIFLLCGFWHGASWNFIAWGAFHGLFLIWERAFALRWLEKIPSPLRHGYVIIVVIFSWIFFRSESLSRALMFLKTMLGAGHATGEILPLVSFLNVENILVALLCAFFSWPQLERLRWPFRDSGRDNAGMAPTSRSLLLATAVLSLLLILSVTYLASNTFNPFIYYRF